MSENIPSVKIAIVAVGRDCFPRKLSDSRRKKVVEESRKLGLKIYEYPEVVETEKDALAAVEDIKSVGCDALCVYLGNFGPEGPETMLAQKFGGPAMIAAAAEESTDTLVMGGRGDAYCGVLNASYNLKLRGVRAYIPSYPVGTPDEIAVMIAKFSIIATVVVGVRNLKVVGFGPRPFNFLACNAPIKPFFDLGAEVMENSELDLFESFNAHKDDPRIEGLAHEMAEELGDGDKFPAVLPRLAQYELTLKDQIEACKDGSKYVVFANKCWPAFQTQFGFVPCYVNSRMAAAGYPVACETDLYGALTEYMLQCATGASVTLLDMNNTVPRDLYEKENIAALGYKQSDLFMGFHCGNTAVCRLRKPTLDYQRIMHSLLEPDSEPNITRGTVEGALKAGNITLFRLQSTADCRLMSYIAEGEILEADPKTFGSTGIFAVKEMGRFYRYALIENGFPHHAGVAFDHVGELLFEAVKLLGVDTIFRNLPENLPYPAENPFAK